MKTGHLENNRRTQWTLQAVFFFFEYISFCFFRLHTRVASMEP